MSLPRFPYQYDEEALLEFARIESDRADQCLAKQDDEGAEISMMGVAEAALAAKRLPRDA